MRFTIVVQHVETWNCCSSKHETLHKQGYTRAAGTVKERKAAAAPTATAGVVLEKQGRDQHLPPNLGKPQRHRGAAPVLHPCANPSSTCSLANVLVTHCESANSRIFGVHPGNQHASRNRPESDDSPNSDMPLHSAMGSMVPVGAVRLAYRVSMLNLLHAVTCSDICRKRHWLRSANGDSWNLA